MDVAWQNAPVSQTAMGLSGSSETRIPHSPLNNPAVTSA